MNIIHLLTPKEDVDYVYSDNTLRQAMEKMQFHGYSAIPIIDRQGMYVEALTEGDLLWFIVNYNCNLKHLENFRVNQLSHRSTVKSVEINSTIDDLAKLSMSQNFVPLTDGRGVFIGIITRRAIIEHYAEYVHKLTYAEANV